MNSSYSDCEEAEVALGYEEEEQPLLPPGLSAAAGLTHLDVRPVQLLNVKVVYVQMELLLAELARCDGFQVGC